VVVVMPWGPTLAYLGPGQVFGEMSLLESIERTAFCKAYTDCLIFEIPKQVFHADLMGNPVVRQGLQEMAYNRGEVQEGIRRGGPPPELVPPEKPETPDTLEGEEAAPGPDGEAPAAAAAPDVAAETPGSDEPKPPAVYASA
jgi:hypothetical protein